MIFRQEGNGLYIPGKSEFICLSVGHPICVVHLARHSLSLRMLDSEYPTVLITSNMSWKHSEAEKQTFMPIRGSEPSDEISMGSDVVAPEGIRTDRRRSREGPIGKSIWLRNGLGHLGARRHTRVSTTEPR